MIFSRGDQDQEQANSKDDRHDGSGKDKPRSFSTEVGKGDRTLARGDEAQAGGNLEEGDVEGIGVPPEVDDCNSGNSFYDPDDDVDHFVDEEMRLAESMSMAVFLSLNSNKEEKHPRRRNSNLKDVNQLETVEEASQGKI